MIDDKKKQYYIKNFTLSGTGQSLSFFSDEAQSDEEICLAAVSFRGDDLKYVKRQTEKICLAAVGRDGLALRYVQNQTEEICFKAVKCNGLAIMYADYKNEKICIEAVKNSGVALHYIENQTDEMCLAAVKSDGSALKYVKRQTEEMCLEAVKKDGMTLEYVKEQTEEIQFIAIKNCAFGLKFIKNQTSKIIDDAVNYSFFNFFELDASIYEYKPEQIKHVFDRVCSIGNNGLNNTRFLGKLTEILLRLNDDDLVKAVKTDLSFIFNNDDLVNSREALINIKQKALLIDAVNNINYNNNVKNKHKIL